MQAYCLKCRKKVPIMHGQVVRMNNGNLRATGKCQCGCGLSVILNKADKEKVKKGGNLFSTFADSVPESIPLLGALGLL